MSLITSELQKHTTQQSPFLTMVRYFLDLLSAAVGVGKLWLSTLDEFHLAITATASNSGRTDFLCLCDYREALPEPTLILVGSFEGRALSVNA
eukprot:96838-Amphidinium_carterae.1